MAKFFDKPTMDDMTVEEEHRVLAGSTMQVMEKYRRQMFAYRVRMFLAGLFAWFLIYVFWVGVVTVFGVDK